MENWLSGLGTPVSAIFAVAGIMLVAHFLGKTLLTRLQIFPRHPIYQDMIGIILGLDILAIISYLTGLCKLLSGTFLETFICMIAFPYFAYMILKINIKDFFFFIRKNSLFFLLSIAIFAGLLGNALCPPGGWDELTYQIELPARWLADNEIKFYPDNLYSAFPGAFSMLIMLALKLGGNTAPRLLVLCLWALALTSIYLILKIRITKNAAALFSIATSISYGFFMCATNTYAEFFIIVQLLGIVMFRLNPASVKKSAILYFIFAGFFAGIAGSVKLTGLAIGAGILTFLVFSSFKKFSFFVKTANFAIAMLITVGIFYLRPLLQTGNPFHPYFANFATDNPAVLSASNFHHAIGSVKYGLDGISSFFTSPLLIALQDNPFDGSFGYQFLITIALVASFFIPLKIKQYRSYEFKMLCFLVIFFYCFWFFTSRQARFFISVSVVAILLVKYSPICLKRKAVLIVSLIAIGLGFASLPDTVFKHSFLSWKCALGILPKQDYLFSLTGDDYLQSIDFIRLRTSQNAKILLLFENRGLYLPRKHEIGTPFYQQKYFTPPENYCDANTILSVLKQNKITHILVGLSLSDPDRLPEYIDRSAPFMRVFGKLRESGNLKPLFETNNYIFFQTTTE